MKIQLEQLDLMKPWPLMRLQDGYHAMQVLVRVGSIPVGEVVTRTGISRGVTARRFRGHTVKKLPPHLLKTTARAGTAAGPEAMKQSGARVPVLAGPNLRH